MPIAPMPMARLASALAPSAVEAGAVLPDNSAMTQDPHRFMLDPSTHLILKDLGISPSDVLRLAGLPQDLLARAPIWIPAKDFFALWTASEQLLDAEDFALRIGEAMSIEAFSPPLFACICSPDLNAALLRMKRYKPLVGPMRLDVQQSRANTRLTIHNPLGPDQVPSCFTKTELVYFTQMARLATRHRIEPMAVTTKVPLSNPDRYEAFFGCIPELGAETTITFAAQDAARPFLTANAGMWNALKPVFDAQLAELARTARMADRVRACLMETLPGGLASVGEVAARLAVSQRTLQRRLTDEGTSFQTVLTEVREELARHYLQNSVHSTPEIAFLLGYNDPNSFYRAFHDWTGRTPDAVRTGDGPPMAH